MPLKLKLGDPLQEWCGIKVLDRVQVINQCYNDTTWGGEKGYVNNISYVPTQDNRPDAVYIINFDNGMVGGFHNNDLAILLEQPDLPVSCLRRFILL
jgi:hypothetical protein